MSGAPDGSYTFHVTSPTAGSVDLRRDGSPVTTVTYDWTTTVSATNSNMFYPFSFAGYFNITIRKAGTGTINLYAMDQSIFDGIHVLTVLLSDGGSGLTVPCGGGNSVLTDENQDKCAASGFVTRCPITVGQYEGCVLAQAPSRGCVFPFEQCHYLVCQ